MKAVSSITLLCSLLFLSAFTSAQVFSLPGTEPTIVQQFRDNQNWWIDFTRKKSLKLLGKVQTGQLELGQCIQEYSSISDTDCQKRAKKLAKQARSLRKTINCRKACRNNTSVAKNAAGTVDGDLFIISKQGHLAILAQNSNTITDAAYPGELLSIEAAAYRLRDRSLRPKSPDH